MNPLIEAIRTFLIHHGGEVTIPDTDFEVAPIQPGWVVKSGGGVMLEAGAKIGADLKLTVDGPNCTLIVCSDAEFRKGAEIRVEGRNSWVFIGQKARLGPCKIFVKGRECSVVLGQGLSWESGAALSYREGQTIIMGDDCMLSNDVRLRTEDGHGIFDTVSKERLNPPKPIVIGPHVWIGHGATVNKGTQIGRGTVLGTEALASGILEAHAIYAGMPARKLREGVTWSRSDKWADIPEEFQTSGPMSLQNSGAVRQQDGPELLSEVASGALVEEEANRSHLPLKAARRPFWRRWIG